MKVCSGCGEEKDLFAFRVDKRRGKPVARCRVCLNAASRAWQQLNADRGRAASRRWAEAHPERARASMRERSWRRQGIELTHADYLALVDAQGGTCAACGEACRRELSVDHDHKSGRVRGLLCAGCNLAAGYLADDPTRATQLASYLERAT